LKRWLAEHNISYEEYDYGFEDTTEEDMHSEKMQM